MTPQRLAEIDSYTDCDLGTKEELVDAVKDMMRDRDHWAELWEKQKCIAQEFEAENDRLREELQQCRDIQVANLAAGLKAAKEVARLREALEWYADALSWDNENPEQYDRGERARAALTQKDLTQP